EYFAYRARAVRFVEPHTVEPQVTGGRHVLLGVVDEQTLARVDPRTFGGDPVDPRIRLGRADLGTVDHGEPVQAQGGQVGVQPVGGVGHQQYGKAGADLCQKLG